MVIAASDFVLERPRLLHRIERILDSHHLVIVAPPGYGKSVLLHRLAAYRPHTFYLPLTLADTDPAVLQARWQDAAVKVQKPATATLILDDIHHLETSPEATTWLLEQIAAETPRLILAGRRFPGLGLNALHAAGRVDVLTRADLSFSGEEVRLFLTQQGMDMASHRAWVERAQGWPLALALLARSKVISAYAVEGDLFAYLASALLHRLSPDLQRFWQLTAVPLHFNAELAGYLLGDPDQAETLLRDIARHNLFLEPASAPGWFRYHDLIREFLLAQISSDLTSVHRRVVVWFRQHEAWEMAVEQALAGALWKEAGDLLEELPSHAVWDYGRYRTFRRWVLTLPDSVSTMRSGLWVRLGRELIETELRKEGWTFLQRGLRTAERNEDLAQQTQARLSMAMAHVKDAAYAEAEALCRQVLASDYDEPDVRLHAFYILGNSLIYGDRFGDARQAYGQALDLAIQLGNEDLAAFIRHNLATYVLIPQGRLETAEILLAANEERFGPEHPNLRVTHLFGRCEDRRVRGDWDGLARVLDEIEHLTDQVELAKTGDDFWTHWFRAMTCTGQGRWEAAESALASASACTGEHPEKVVCLAWARCWLARRRMNWRHALQVADALLPAAQESPFYRGVLALERSIAAGCAWLEGEADKFALHPATSVLIKTRARPYLIRLQALLALICHRHGEDRWRRHARAALRGLLASGLEGALTAGDPDLGARFWALLLAEGLAVERATAGLLAIRAPYALAPLLDHPNPQVRMRAGQVLAEMGQETGIPLLARALENERSPQVRAGLEAALDRLEQVPPPRLEVHLMGEFVLRRDGEILPDSIWPRPVVRHLFQYFALHREQLLPRERILEDLWPDAPPDKAWATFRSVYSRLRRALEPHLRAKHDSRYFTLVGDAYRFDPHGVVETDVERLEEAVIRTLDQAERSDVPSIPVELVTGLEGYAPLLSGLPHEDWLLSHRERLQQRYLDGCLYLARACLVHGQSEDAIPWAERAVVTGPWLEEGHRLLMRGLARSGHRSRALKVYDDAVNALRRELDAPPSARIGWLATRLRQGEEI